MLSRWIFSGMLAAASLAAAASLGVPDLPAHASQRPLPPAGLSNPSDSLPALDSIVAGFSMQPRDSFDLAALRANGADTTAIKPAPGIPSAWTLAYPLGQHLPARIDTLLYNYQRMAIPSMQYDAVATTGNLGSESLPMIFSQRPRTSNFFFDRGLATWTPSLHSQKFYNVYTPMTLLSYDFAGNRQNHTDRLTAQFGGNVNRNIGVAAFVDYLYSKGCYENQATKDIAYGANAFYTGHRYEMQVLFNAFNFLNKENGGITDDLYITDPAALQGGVDKIEPKSIPTRLTAAHTRLTGSRFFTTQAFKVGFWREEAVNDTLTREVYVPVTKFIYSLDYQTRHHMFKNTSPSEARDFWDATYFNPDETYDNARYWHLANTLGIEMMEGFQKWAKFGLSAYATYQYARYKAETLTPLPDESAGDSNEDADNGLTPLPAGSHPLLEHTRNLLWIGARLQKQQGSILHYAADARFGMVGDVAGDVEINGSLSTQFPLLGDTVSISADARFANREPDQLLKRFVSNHFIWDNRFGKSREFHAGASLRIPWTRTTLSATVDNIQNLVYFDSSSLPVQHGGNVQIVSASLDQELHFGIWNWNNRLTWQLTSDKDVVPLPALTLYSNMYLAFRAFRVLDLQIGVDCDYFTRYRGMMYQPATMAFHVQNPEEAISVGNYPFANAYITAKLYKVRFFVLWSHFNQGWFSSDYFSMPHYPLNPRRLQFGLSIDFAD